jgi:hypothetical protein
LNPYARRAKHFECFVATITPSSQNKVVAPARFELASPKGD